MMLMMMHVLFYVTILLFETSQCTWQMLAEQRLRTTQHGIIS
jgi:outer membrane lipoprotein-sorting protein